MNNRMYIKSKILTNPMDYTLSDKLIVETALPNNYLITNKTINGEVQLAELLELEIPNVDDNTYFKANDKLILPSDIEIEYEAKRTPLFLKWNNLYYILNTVKIMTGYNEKVEQPLMNLICKLLQKDTLCNALFYLVDDKFYKENLFDITELKLAKEYIKNKKMPMIACFIDEFKGVTMLPYYPLFAINDLDISTNQWKPLARLGCYITTFLLCEILYQYSTLSDEDKMNINSLFEENFTPFMEEFYTLDINKLNLKHDLSSDNSDRFEEIKKISLELCTKYNYFEHTNTNLLMNATLAVLVEAVYYEGMKNARLEHIQLMYSEAKKRDVLDKAKDKDYSAIAEDTDLLDVTGKASEGFEGPSSSESRPESLFDLNDFGECGMQPESKDTVSRRKAEGAKLHEIDKLHEDNSRLKAYKFNINDVKSSSGSKSRYMDVSNKLERLKKSLIKSIREIKTYNTGGKQSGLTSGKLDTKNLYKYKQTKEIFCRNNYKIKEMDLAFGIVLDMSGSMCGSKVEDGKITMILFHEVLTALRINHAIIGHDSNGMQQSNIYKYYYFNEDKVHHTVATPYQLVDIKALSGNCDSGALAYMENMMHKVKNKDKICIIFSDGEPTECTGNQLVEQIKHMEKHGIHVIGIGIQFDEIKEYYSDYANGENMADMVRIITEILHRYVLEKKE